MEKEPWAESPAIGLLLGIFSSKSLLLNVLLNRYHYLLHIPPMRHYVKPKLRAPPPPSPSCLLPASPDPHNPSQGPLPSVQCHHQSHGPLCPPPFLRSCSWKLRVQPDDNLPIFSRKKWCEDLSNSMFVPAAMFGISQAASWQAHWPWQCLSKEASCLSLGSPPTQACVQQSPGAPWGAEASHAQHSPAPTPRPHVRAAGTVGASMAFKCYSKTGKQAWKV